MIDKKIKDLVKDKNNLSEIVKWFCIENNLSVNDINDKNIKTLIQQLKSELNEEIDEKSFKELLEKIK